jgi:ABC-2 type transport system permease protein
VLRNGLGAESLAWSLMFLLLPLTCVYYPVEVLPGWLQTVSWSLPPTYVFEGLRALVSDGVYRGDLMLWALGLNAVLIAVAAVVFVTMFNASRRAGSLLSLGE